MSISQNIFNAIKTLIESRAEKNHSHSAGEISDFPEIPTVPEMAIVATTGRYEDLTDKPTIPADMSGELQSLAEKLRLLMEELDGDVEVDDSTISFKFEVTENWVNNSPLFTDQDQLDGFGVESCEVLIDGSATEFSPLSITANKGSTVEIKLNFENNFVSSLSESFFECWDLTCTISFPALTSIGEDGMEYAFSDCTNLTGPVSFPKLASISNYGMYYTFCDCRGLTGPVSFPSLTSIDKGGMNHAFYECTGLTGSVSFPKLTSIGDKGLFYAFCGCSGLTGLLSFPALTTIGNSGMNNAFYRCPGLTSVSFPALTSIGSDGMCETFEECTNLTEIHYPRALSGCTYASNGGAPNATVYFDL